MAESHPQCNVNYFESLRLHEEATIINICGVRAGPPDIKDNGHELKYLLKFAHLMGHLVSRIFGAAKREITMYNIEQRAEKIISKDKPSPAPKYPSTIDELRRLENENVSKEYLLKKHEKLDNFLKQVYVTSPGPTPQTKRIENPSRPLPASRAAAPPDESVYGYSAAEERQTAAGRVSLRQALQFIADHESDGSKHSAAAVADQYGLAPPTVEDILEHFKMFHIKVQKKEPDPESLPASEKLRRMTENLNPMTLKKFVKAANAAGKDSKEQLPVPENGDSKDKIKVDSGKKLSEQESSESLSREKELSENKSRHDKSG